MKYREVEFKYNAEGISLAKFHEFCRGRTPFDYLSASSPDHFYCNTKNDGSFYRFRDGGDFKQLTFKKKTVDQNNFIRTEHNITLASTTKEDQVRALVAEHGYKYDTSVFKTCFIYFYDYYTLVYYVCLDYEHKEIGRFVEIEVNEDYPWKSEQEAWDSLIALEKLCKGLGVSPQARIKKSLYEMFTKGV